MATVLVPLVLVAGVVVAVLALGTADDAPAPDDASSTPTLAVTSTPDVRPDPQTWCLQFRTFVEANTQFVAGPGDATADALVREGRALLELGQPLGLEDSGLSSLSQLVTGALAGAGGPTEVPSGAPADPAVLDGYLATTCPA